MSRSEVWWADVPTTGRRPCLVLTRQTAIPLLHAVLAVPATSTIRGIPTEVAIGPDDGMPAETVLSLDNLVVLPKSRFVEPICRLSTQRMREVCKALAIATGCDVR